jgi:hypothetical protein
LIAHNANKARGIVRAAAYIANNQRRLRWDVSRRDQVLRTDDPRDRKPLATRTLIAVTTEASRIAFVVVIDPSL